MTIRALVWQIPLLGVAWIAVLAVVALAQTAPNRGASAYLVLLPQGHFLRDLPQGAAVVGRSDVSITLASTAPQFAAQLYRSGAWLVLPAGLKGCAAL